MFLLPSINPSAYDATETDYTEVSGIDFTRLWSSHWGQALARHHAQRPH